MLKKTAHLPQLPDWLPPLLACLFFLAAGALFLPRLGLQNDEALFASPWFAPRDSAYAIKVGHSTLPLMLLSYLGTLKSWIYRPLFRYLGTDILVVRLPMLLAATASVWLFYEFLRKVAGRRAAYIGCGLLAVDATYLLTACFDWGPVALQHLLLLGGLCLVVKFRQERSERALAAAFFLFGLAMWDKALAIWMLGAMAVAGMVVYPRPILESFRRRRATLAVLAFLLGALPLVIYNAKTRLATFRSTVAYDTSDIAHKAYILELTADGSGLFDWMVDEDDQTPHPHQPEGFLERASASLAKWTGRPRRDLLLAAFCLALLLAPLASRQDR
ncbi:MAG TPA: glycosyltransferase family 39 protein, partial [Bryobacteraceae bacterium]|nr:glycosyltransferase family 39 protein [Bryobacteraceae bacterium]